MQRHTAEEEHAPRRDAHRQGCERLPVKDALNDGSTKPVKRQEREPGLY
jgi:hypothetical protein